MELNKELYTATGSQFIGILSPKSKHLLTLPEPERTGAAFVDLLSEMENIRVFAMFSNRTKELLAKKLKFVTHRANDFLLKQGEENNPPQAFYIIASGVVVEQYKQLVADAECPNVWPEKILGKYEFFGHVDIIHNRLPTVDAQTVGYSELLMLSKEDFHIARKDMEAHCTLTTRHLRSSKAIGRFAWTDEEYKMLEIYSKLCSYVKDQEVYTGVENNRSFWSYFVVSGTCKIMREVNYHATDTGALKAIPYQLRNELKVDKTSNLIQFEQATNDFYFGIGENFTNNHVIAGSTLECLLIPRLLLVFKDRGLLHKMARDLTDSMPSDQQVLYNYSKLVAASKEKVQMFRDLFKDKPERLIENQ